MGVKIFQWMNFFFSANCLHEFFFRRESSARFFFDSTSFNVQEMQNFAQFNYSTAEGDSLFGVLIFAKFEFAIIEKEMSYYKRYRTSCLEGRFFTCEGNSASSCWSILFFTVERKG